MSMAATVDRPVADVDPFSHAFLENPYPHHEAMREAGPVIWLEQYGIWAMARHQEVRDALTDWQTYCSGAGVGLSDFRKEPPWRPPSIILEADPPLHTRTRTVLNRILSPAAINRLRETFTREAEALVGRLVELREFDGVADLSEAFPLKVFPDAVGLADEGRKHLLAYGSMVFNSFGPRNDLFDRAMANAGTVRDWIMSRCSRAALAPEVGIIGLASSATLRRTTPVAHVGGPTMATATPNVHENTATSLPGLRRWWRRRRRRQRQANA